MRGDDTSDEREDIEFGVGERTVDAVDGDGESADMMECETSASRTDARF